MKVLLCDADGVLTIPEDFFSNIYARSHGLETEPFERFFKEIFPPALKGQADLKELIGQHKDIWPYGTPDEIVQQWCEAEDLRNEEALVIIKQLRAQGIKCYLATNQEKYRGQYMKNVMFKDLFDGYFISSEMGVQKPEAEFFEAALAQMREDLPGLQSEEVTFVDDTMSHIEGAKAFGLEAMLYTGLDQLKSLL